MAASEEHYRRISKLMTANNPMKRPEVAQKMALSRRGVKTKFSPAHREFLSKTARQRMLSDKNPMKNPKIAQKAFRNRVQRPTSLHESAFKDWLEANNFPIQHTGNNFMWINRRNPDFRVTGQKKAIELTQGQCFNNHRILRTMENYARPTIQHYQASKWQCLVIFLKKNTEPCLQLKNALINFMLPECNWSGVWNYDKLILFGKLQKLN
jgi:hypothetical protein